MTNFILEPEKWVIVREKNYPNSDLKMKGVLFIVGRHKFLFCIENYCNMDKPTAETYMVGKVYNRLTYHDGCNCAIFNTLDDEIGGRIKTVYDLISSPSKKKQLKGCQLFHDIVFDVFDSYLGSIYIKGKYGLLEKEHELALYNDIACEYFNPIGVKLLKLIDELEKGKTMQEILMELNS